MDTFKKRENPRTPGQLAYEVAGLEWLAQSCEHMVVPVAHFDGQTLEEPRLRSVSPTGEAAYRFGRELAILHGTGVQGPATQQPGTQQQGTRQQGNQQPATQQQGTQQPATQQSVTQQQGTQRQGIRGWGCPPPGFDGQGWIGLAPLSLPNRQGSWGEFYAQERIRPYLSAFGGQDLDVMRRFCDLLETGRLDHDQPRRVDGLARTHGDLWSGNVMWTAQGAILIDPAAQGGHAEEDLAALALFGAPFLRQIIAGYQQESKLADGWEDRIELHQGHMLAVHAYLFGGGYVRQCVEVAAKYLGQAG